MRAPNTYLFIPCVLKRGQWEWRYYLSCWSTTKLIVPWPKCRYYCHQPSIDTQTQSEKGCRSNGTVLVPCFAAPNVTCGLIKFNGTECSFTEERSCRFVWVCACMHVCTCVCVSGCYHDLYQEDVTLVEETCDKIIGLFSLKPLVCISAQCTCIVLGLAVVCMHVCACTHLCVCACVKVFFSAGNCVKEVGPAITTMWQLASLCSWGCWGLTGFISATLPLVHSLAATRVSQFWF